MERRSVILIQGFLLIFVDRHSHRSILVKRDIGGRRQPGKASYRLQAEIGQQMAQEQLHLHQGKMVPNAQAGAAAEWQVGKGMPLLDLLFPHAVGDEVIRPVVQMSRAMNTVDKYTHRRPRRDSKVTNLVIGFGDPVGDPGRRIESHAFPDHLRQVG